MSDYEARINTRFGELVIHFIDKIDLSNKLQDVGSLVQIIETTTKEFAVVKESVVTGLEGICTLTAEGLPHILVYPETDSDKVRLALFASQRSLSSEEITKVTGVRNPTALRLLKFDEVIKADGKFTLSGKGRSIVSKDLLPKMAPMKES